MNKEPIYRIRIEVIGQEDEDCTLDEDCKVFECNGFALILDNPGKSTTLIQHVTTIDLARAIASAPDMLCASTIAKGLFEAKKIKDAAKNPLVELFKSMDK